MDGEGWLLADCLNRTDSSWISWAESFQVDQNGVGGNPSNQESGRQDSGRKWSWLETIDSVLDGRGLIRGMDSLLPGSVTLWVSRPSRSLERQMAAPVRRTSHLGYPVI
jgi:hypothetical protein